MTRLKSKALLERFDERSTQRKTEIQTGLNGLALAFLKDKRHIVLDLPGKDLEKCNRFFNTFRLVYLIERDRDVYDYVRKNREIVQTKTTLFHGDFFKAITMINGPGKVSLVNYDGMGVLDNNLFHRLVAIIQDRRMAVRSVLRMTFCLRGATQLNVDSKLAMLWRHADEIWKVTGIDTGWSYAEPVGPSADGIQRTGAPMYTVQWYMEKR